LDTEFANAVEIIQNQSKAAPEAVLNATGEAPQEPAKSGATPTDGKTQDPAGQKPESPGAPEAKEPTEKEKQAELLSKRFATLSTKERELQRMQVQLKREREEIDRLKAEKGESKPKSYDNPMELLEAHGWNYDDVTQHVLTGKKPESKKARELEEKLKALEDERKAEREAKEKTEKEQEQTRQVTEYKAGIKSKLSAEAERFELVHKFGDAGVDLVYDTMVQWYSEFGEAPDPLEIADRVEAYYEGRVKEEIGKFKSAKKLSTFFQEEKAPGPAGSTATKPEVKTEAESVLGMKTLTNSQSQTATKTASKQLSDEELIAEAAKLISAR
jgi:hypothetical protein